MKKLLTVLLAAAMILSIMAVPAAASENPGAFDPSQPIEVNGGQITGAATEDGAVAYFKGIPYAADTSGENRWKAPQDVTPWEGVKECTEFGPSFMQGNEGAFGNYTDEFLNSNRTYSEDALSLSVWTGAASADEKRPVLFYVHGGGNTSGGASCPIYDGELMARKGVVYVAINYRLNVFGQLVGTALNAESELGVSGNYIVLDCIKALEWVRDNISKFGGDPENVTIMGQSAGAGNVNNLTISPLASGLFKGAFIESGATASAGNGLNPDVMIPNTLDNMLESGDAYIEANGGLEALRAMSSQEVLDITQAFSAAIDGVVIPSTNLDAMVAGTINDVPTINGNVTGDGFMGSVIDTNIAKITGLSKDAYIEAMTAAFGDLAEEALAIYPPVEDNNIDNADEVNMDRSLMNAITYARCKSAFTKTPGYVYYYTHPYAGDAVKGAFHSSDICYFLGGVFNPDLPFGELDQTIADTLSGYLVNFVASGDVNGEGLPVWNAADGSDGYLLIADDGIRFVYVPDVKAEFWTKYFNGLLGTDFDFIAAPEGAEFVESIVPEKVEAEETAAVSDEDAGIKFEAGEGSVVNVYEWAAGAWQPVGTDTPMYPIICKAFDADGNEICDLTVTDSVCDYSAVADQVSRIDVTSTFTGNTVSYTIPTSGIKIEPTDRFATINVYEWAAGAWQPVGTDTPMYPILCKAYDADGNEICDLYVGNAVCDYSEVFDTAARIDITSTFTGEVASYAIPEASIKFEKGDNPGEFKCYEWAAGAWQPVGTDTPMYPIIAVAYDAAGNDLGNVTVADSLGSIAEYPDAVGVAVTSTFTGITTKYDIVK
ncbi:MAG: carboxylesterase family protein [Parasporobacterium sp.]|nr:carboxylesterase family protein [Parasporobacterium sp.]